MIAAHRVDRVRSRLLDEGVGAVIVSDPVNVAYLTGFEGVFDDEDAHAAVISENELCLYTDGRYAEAARRAAEDGEWEIVVPSENLYTTLCQDLTRSGIDAVAIEESVPHGRFRFISRQFDGNIAAVDQWVEEVRQVKSSDEVARIGAAQELTDRAFDYILGVIKAGMSEREIALELEFFMRRNGSDGVAFPAIVASGPNSSRPHAKVTDRVVQSGEFLKMDFGARLGGYCADMTRTIVVGRASERQREIYEAVLAANQAGIDAIAPGRTGKQIDAAAREVLSGRGLGELFTHGLGHGVGMEVHELPYVGPRGTKSVLAGSVVTVEPGVYEAGVQGVRIEDLVVVEESGARVLTTSPKDLIEL